MNTSFKSIQAFTEHAAKTYLQSAVFIDDKIYNQGEVTSIPVDKVIASPKRKPAVKVRKEQSKDVEEGVSTTTNLDETNESNLPFSTQDLVGSFAKYGIVCAPYQPKTNFKTDENSEVFKLCEAADLVILDWDFGSGEKQQGDKSKELIGNLVQGANKVSPHHVRLIIIYTTLPSLLMVKSQIFDHLESLSIEVEPHSDQGLSLQAGSARVIVLGKPSGARSEQDQQNTVEEKNLAEKVIEEFSVMNKGILPSCALLGMSAVRRNSRRILDKFHGSIDEAFLFHRALIMGSEEGFDQLPELLADEMRAVVEDASIYPREIHLFLKNILDELSLKEENWKKKETNDPVSSKLVLKDLLLSGLSGLSKHKDIVELDKIDGKGSFHRIDKKLLEKLMKLVSLHDDKSHDRWATLMGTRTQYSFDNCHLTFGTIVQDDADSYLLCIMPLCDSVRLKKDKPVSFPFWKLEKLTAENGHGFVVEIGQQEYQGLMRKGKVREMLRMDTFQPNSKTQVVKAEKEGENFFFASSSKKYQWIAQLKPAHAQRIVQQIGQSLSRVGLTEAEWVRLMCDR